MSMTNEEFLAYILLAPSLEEIETLDGDDAYDGCARLAAKMTYEHLQQFPEDNLLNEGDLYDRVEVTHPNLDKLDLTGFMWGYAMQSAERLLHLPIKPNPAILTLAVPE